MRIQKMTFARAVALCLPLLLAGCGEPVDPCKTRVQKIKGKDLAHARERALNFVEKRKITIAKQYAKPLKFGTPTITCSIPEKPEPKPKKVNPNDPWVKKTKERPQFAICEVVLPYCVK